MSGESFDVAVIGGGPGGYVAAIKAAQLGLKVLVSMVAIYFRPHALNPEDLSAVKYYQGHGSFLSPKEIQIVSRDEKKHAISAQNIVIATGSSVLEFPGAKIDERTIVSSTGALSLSSVPKHLVIIGGGIIGLELGSVWNRLGSKVTVVEYLDTIGAGMDGAVSAAFQRILQKQGIEFRLGTKVESISEQKNGLHRVQCSLRKDPKKQEELSGDIVLVSIGRRPNTSGLSVEKAGLELDEKGRIKTGSGFKTNVPNVYAIGDVIAGPMLAHKAEEEGIAVAEIISGGHGHVNYNAVPSVVYTHPEVAWCGKTEEELRSSGIQYNSGIFPFMANSRAKTIGDTEGFVKILAEMDTGRILGAHIIGPNAGEMISEAVIAIEYGASAEDIARTCHAHPVLFLLLTC